MVDTHSAGSGDKLSAVRYGWEHSAQYERVADSAIDAGTVVMKGSDDTFEAHDGSADANAFIAVEDRGRGMDLKNPTYDADDQVKALKPAEETGFNVLLSDGEDVSEGDALVIDGDNAGQVVAYVSADDDVTDILGYAAEDLDLSGSPSEAGYVAFEVE